MDLERKVRKLKRWNAAWICSFVLAVGFYLWSFSLYQVQVAMRQLKVHDEGTRLVFSMGSHGPCVVTHLVAYGDSEADKRWAALPVSLAIVDSHGASVETDRLKWKDYRGEDASPPSASSIEVLYSFPIRSSRSRN